MGCPPAPRLRTVDLPAVDVSNEEEAVTIPVRSDERDSTEETLLMRSESSTTSG